MLSCISIGAIQGLGRKEKQKKKAVQNIVLVLAYVNTYSYSLWSSWDLKAIQSQNLLQSFSSSTFEMAIKLLSPEIQLCPLHTFKKHSWSRLLCIARSDHISNSNSKFLRRLQDFSTSSLFFFFQVCTHRNTIELVIQKLGNELNDPKWCCIYFIHYYQQLQFIIQESFDL